MPRVVFTSHLQRHVDCQTIDVAGETLREVLENVYREFPKLRDYVVDEAGEIRKHVAIFVAGKLAVDRRAQSDAVPAQGEVYVMQALSGG